MRNLKIYKGLLLIGTSSFVLVSCGKVVNVEDTNSYVDEYVNETEPSNDINISDENVVIHVYDEFGNEVSNDSIVVESSDNTIESDTPSENDNTFEETNNNITEMDEETKDNTILNYFIEKKEELNNTVDFTEYKEKAVSLFITAVDFIFYDGEIYGIHYNELKDETKKTILNDFAEIDTIISSKYPNYKEDVQAKYDKAADWTVESYNIVINYIKSGLSDESLDNINALKESLKETVGSLADTAESIYNDQKVKVKDWYEKYRENH